MMLGRYTFAREASVGDELCSVTNHLSQDQIKRYAVASGDHNPLHLDEAFAKTTQFGGTIGHGMLVLAFVSEMLTETFGFNWLHAGRLKIRFRAPARPGQTLTTGGRIAKVEGTRIVSEIECRNDVGEVLVDGTAEVTVFFP